MPDLSLNIIGNNLAGDAIKGVAGSLKGMGDAAAQFTLDSVKAFGESQRAIAQLNRVAGDATDTFVEQATQMQNTLGVSDDMVMGLQKLTLTFGAAQTQVEPTTRAILDYAAATGKDATAAMEMLLRGVESGTGELKKMGITFEATGDQSKDLALATEALSAKYGGAAAADANTLAGRTRIAQAAMEDLQKSFGGLVTDFVVGTGAIDKVTFAVRELQYAMSDEKKDLDETNAREKARIELKEKLLKINQMLASQSYGNGDALGGLTKAQLEMEKLDAEMRLTALDIVKQQREAKMNAGLSSDGSHDLTAAARSEQKSAAEAAIKEHQKGARDLLADIKRAAKQQVDAYVDGEKETAKEIAAARAEATEESRLALAQAHVEERSAIAAQQAALQQSEEEFWTDFGRTTAKGIRDAREGQQVQAELDQTEQQFADAGKQIGLAMASEIGKALEEMLSGGEVDGMEVFGDILASILTVAGTVIGGVVGNVGGAAVGGALGGLAGSAVRGATRRRKRHSGGWSDAEEFHGGGWPGLSSEEIPAVLQEGERVLSRQEVGRMGGRSGVDSAARGGGRGGVTIQIASIDTKGVRDAFSGEAGRGFQESIQSGRGDMARLFGAGVY